MTEIGASAAVPANSVCEGLLSAERGPCAERAVEYTEWMNGTTYCGELERALARSDADQMCRQLDAYATYTASDGGGEWPEEHADAFGDIISCHDPEKAFAYVILGASRTDDARFLGLLGCGPLEDVLANPSDKMLERIVVEAQKIGAFLLAIEQCFQARDRAESLERHRKISHYGSRRRACRR